MSSKAVEFGGILLRIVIFILPWYAQGKSLTASVPLVHAKMHNYYLGIISATSTDAVNKLNKLRDQEEVLIDFDYLRDLLHPALPGPASWMDSMPKKASLKEIVNTIALVTHLA